MTAPDAQQFQVSLRADTTVLEAQIADLTAKVDNLVAYLHGQAMPGAYTPAQAAEALKVSEDLVYELIRTKRLPAVRVGERNLRIPARALQAYLDGDIPRENPAAKAVVPFRR